MRWPVNILPWCWMAAVIVLCQAEPNERLARHSRVPLRSDCLGSVMRVSLDRALEMGNGLEVEAVNGTEYHLLHPNLARQCGYSMESDPWGNTRIYTSLLACYVDSKDDATFDVGLRLTKYNQENPSDSFSYDVSKSCTHRQWASTEILCERNYMEASVHMAPSQYQVKGLWGNATSESSDAEHGVWKVAFYTPKEVVMTATKAEEAGYSTRLTPSRLVMRSPYNTAETHSEEVAGIPMEVIKVSVYYKEPQGMNIVNLAAACPTGGVISDNHTISWYVPRRVTPLVDATVDLSDVQMGINGKILDEYEMSERGYTLSGTDFYVVLEMPVGSPDGYYKSHAPDSHYHITYSVEPMLEMLWRQDDVRYKILFPITINLTPSIQHQDDTEPEERVFSILLGAFLNDVALKNITFSTGVLTVEECKAAGFLIREHGYPNGTKGFSIQVPFDDDVVLKHNPQPLDTQYTLPLVFGFLVMPEETAFSHSVKVEASLRDVVLPTIGATCDDRNFYVTVRYGSQGNNFETTVGPEQLSPEVKREYGYQENGTSFSLVVPFNSKASVFERFTSNSITARVDVLLYNPIANWNLVDLSLTCSFPFTTTTCYPNGTVTVVAVKVESVPSLDTKWLSLKDQACKPEHGSDRFAFFTFTVDSCGTTRKFSEDYIIYENQIGQNYNPRKGPTFAAPADSKYKQTVTCYYAFNDTQTVSFKYKAKNSNPATAVGFGQLAVQMRLAHDELFEFFYHDDEYPVVRLLRQPLYFEVGLLQSSDQRLELVLENCWATADKDRTSTPSWDIIINGCPNHEDRYVTAFHSGSEDPPYLKRFSMSMFTFTKDEEVLQNEIYVHCDAVVCVKNKPASGICRGQCVDHTARNPFRNPSAKGQRRGQRSADSSQWAISSGPILLTQQSDLRTNE